MGEIISINRDKYLGEYCDPQDVARIPEGLLFAVGVILTVGLPQLILSAYGGIVTLIALVGVTLLGFVAGAFVYFFLPYRIPRCVETEIAVQSPPSKGSRLKKAA